MGRLWLWKYEPFRMPGPKGQCPSPLSGDFGVDYGNWLQRIKPGAKSEFELINIQQNICVLNKHNIRQFPWICSSCLSSRQSWLNMFQGYGTFSFLFLLTTHCFIDRAVNSWFLYSNSFYLLWPCEFFTCVIVKIMPGRTYFSNYCSSEERAQTQTKMGFKLKFYLLNLTAVTGTNYKASSRTFGVGIIFVLPISEGDRERKSNDGHKHVFSSKLARDDVLVICFFFNKKKVVREIWVTFLLQHNGFTNKSVLDLTPQNWGLRTLHFTILSLISWESPLTFGCGLCVSFNVSETEWPSFVFF